MKTIGVIGAGTMGQGIAQVFATGGMQALLYDAIPSASDNAINKIDEGLKQLILKGKLNEDKRQEIIDKILPVQSLDQVKGDMIIEAVVEDLAVKQNLFLSLEKNNSRQT